MHAVTDLRLVCREGALAALLAALAVHELDVVLADSPAAEDVKVKAFSHLVGECGVTFFAAPRLAGLSKGFPRSLDGAPVLLPSAGHGAPALARRAGSRRAASSRSWPASSTTAR